MKIIEVSSFLILFCFKIYDSIQSGSDGNNKIKIMIRTKLRVSQSEMIEFPIINLFKNAIYETYKFRPDTINLLIILIILFTVDNYQIVKYPNIFFTFKKCHNIFHKQPVIFLCI